MKLIHHRKPAVQKEVCWTVSNLTAGNHEQINEVYASGIMEGVLHLLETGDSKTRKEAAWAISNAASGGTEEQVMYVLRL